MSHLIVPLETPQSRRFDKKKKNEMIFRCQLKELDFPSILPSLLNKWLLF